MCLVWEKESNTEYAALETNLPETSSIELNNVGMADTIELCHLGMELPLCSVACWALFGELDSNIMLLPDTQIDLAMQELVQPRNESAAL